MNSDLEISFENFKGDVYREFDKALRRAIRKTAAQIKEGTVSNAKAGIKTYNNHPNDPYNGDSILDAVRISKLEDRYDEDDMYMKVHVMGTKKEDSQTYRFRFLEKGTRNRSYKSKNGVDHNLGKINAKRYFRNAVNSVNAEQIFQEEVEKAINNING